MRLASYRTSYPDGGAELQRRLNGDLPPLWDGGIPVFNAENGNVASRAASGVVLNAIAARTPELIGGSADLTPSNNTSLAGAMAFSPDDYAGRYIHFGIREHGMGAILNGMAVHGGIMPFGGTFLVFSDYMRGSIRLAALMRAHVIYVYTHDSIGLGEDGPTHQSVEHVSSLRLIPNMSVWRPCDTVETAVAWRHALERRDGPTCLVLTRQNSAFQKRTAEQRAAIARGGYVLAPAARAERVILIATGSEVELAMKARELLAAEGIGARVVSMPCTSLFDSQDAAWRSAVLPRGLPRVSVEAGVTDYWRKYVGLEGGVVGIDRFGESAPARDAFEYFGITAANVARVAKATLG